MSESAAAPYTGTTLPIRVGACMDLDPTTVARLDDADLVLQFESIGDNCELGLVQRQAGAEPLGLLRFAGAPLRNLLRGLNARFANIADPGHIRISPENGEFMVKLTKYDFTFHSQVRIGQPPRSWCSARTRICRAAIWSTFA
ncbi:MAG: hypothetical protein ABSC06_23630 [Rhodopila sp.]